MYRIRRKAALALFPILICSCSSTTHLRLSQPGVALQQQQQLTGHVTAVVRLAPKDNSGFTVAGIAVEDINKLKFTINHPSLAQPIENQVDTTPGSENRVDWTLPVTPSELPYVVTAEGYQGENSVAGAKVAATFKVEANSHQVVHIRWQGTTLAQIINYLNQAGRSDLVEHMDKDAIQKKIEQFVESWAQENQALGATAHESFLSPEQLAKHIMDTGDTKLTQVPEKAIQAQVVEVEVMDAVAGDTAKLKLSDPASKEVNVSVSEDAIRNATPPKVRLLVPSVFNWANVNSWKIRLSSNSVTNRPLQLSQDMVVPQTFDKTALLTTDVAKLTMEKVEDFIMDCMKIQGDVKVPFKTIDSTTLNIRLGGVTIDSFQLVPESRLKDLAVLKEDVLVKEEAQVIAKVAMEPVKEAFLTPSFSIQQLKMEVAAEEPAPLMAKMEMVKMMEKEIACEPSVALIQGSGFGDMADKGFDNYAIYLNGNAVKVAAWTPNYVAFYLENNRLPMSGKISIVGQQGSKFLSYSMQEVVALQEAQNKELMLVEQPKELQAFEAIK